MPIYKFRGFAADGSERKGTVQADGLKDAIARLRRDGIIPKDIASQAVTGKRRFFFRGKGEKLSQLTRQLSILLASGVSLNDSLRSLAEENAGFWKSLLVDLREKLSSGSSLSKAMETHAGIFPEFYIRMVQAGEKGGMLDDVLMRLADFLEKELAIRSKVTNAMVYPLFMFSIGIIVLSFVFTFVVPKIVVIFENARSSLPFITVVLIAISKFFQSFWWAMIILAFGLYYGGKRVRERRPELFDSLFLKIPLSRSLYISRFTRIFGFLLSGGVPLIAALDLASKSTGNSVLRGILSRAGSKITEGAGVAASLEELPPVLRQMISTGEKSGQLPQLLERAADSYEEEFSKKVDVMLTLLEPSMIVVMGLVVGFIVFAVLLPIFEMNQLIK